MPGPGQKCNANSTDDGSSGIGYGPLTCVNGGYKGGTNYVFYSNAYAQNYAGKYCTSGQGVLYPIQNQPTGSGYTPQSGSVGICRFTNVDSKFKQIDKE